MSVYSGHAADLPDNSEVIDSDTNTYIKDAGWHGLWSCSDGQTYSTGDIAEVLANGGSVLRVGDGR